MGGKRGWIPSALALGAAAAAVCSAVAGPEPMLDVVALPPWKVPDIAALPDDEDGRLTRYGRDLVAHTAALIGPDAPDPAMRYARAGLNCQSCHLDAGVARFALPLVGIASLYPAFSARSNSVATMGDRINNCMLRSMNGAPLPPTSRELRAIEAYIRFLGKDAPEGEAPVGRGAPKLPLPVKAADPVHGASVYQSDCAVCHGADGKGYRTSSGEAAETKQRYVFPPLWGDESYNDGAGMAHVIAFAQFVRANMPLGVTFRHPVLGVKDAYDVAGFVDSRPRPHFAGLAQDYPDPWLKPADVASPPFLGPFPKAQHRFGPWRPIEDWLERNRPKHARAPADGELEEEK